MVADKPQRRMNLEVALIGHQFSAFLFEVIPYGLDGKIVQFPVRHFDLLVRYEGGRRDGPIGRHLQQPPSRRPYLPLAGPLFHRHYARVAAASVRHCMESTSSSGRKCGDAIGIEADKEKLIAEPEGKMLQHWRIKMRPQPIDGSLTLLLEMAPGGQPAVCEVLRHLSHWNLVHGPLPDRATQLSRSQHDRSNATGAVCKTIRIHALRWHKSSVTIARKSFGICRGGQHSRASASLCEVAIKLSELSPDSPFHRYATSGPPRPALKSTQATCGVSGAGVPVHQ